MSISQKRYFQFKILEPGQIYHALETIDSVLDSSIVEILRLSVMHTETDGAYSHKDISSLNELERICDLSIDRVDLLGGSADGFTYSISLSATSNKIIINLSCQNRNELNREFDYLRKSLGLEDALSPDEEYDVNFEKQLNLLEELKKQMKTVNLIHEETKDEEIMLPKNDSPVIFIGHGGSSQWRNLKDHLQDKHQLTVEAYEVGARAGYTVQQVLDKMLSSSSIALLVMTGEDEDKDGKFHARENVIHEVGLFQGKLGFSRTIILLEDGTTEFSNIQGITQIRFNKGNIAEVFGDVLATIKREFPHI